jgi:membrane fusion protein (multidrug efflux system)
MLLGVLVAAVVGGWAWLSGGRYVSSDNAYVRADLLLVSTDVSGVVQAIPVREGQQVRAGEVLFRLDPAPFRFAVAGAEAKLRQTALSIEAMKQDYLRMERDAAAQEAAVRLAQAQFDRYADLVRTSSVSRADFDQSRFRLDQAQQQLAALRQQAQVQLARLGGDPEIAPQNHPDFQQAAAELDEARRRLERAVVRAPFDAVVTRVESLQPGQYLEAGTPAFGLVGTGQVWVEVNPKETDLTWVKPGDPVTFTVDAYPGRNWRGVVDSISPATGAQFSVLPAQNTSGNWVKVVQRVPVRVRVEPEPDAPPLRAGMSVVARIDTGHRRTLADLF